MKVSHITWRKATEEERLNGHPEMIKVSTVDHEVEDVIEEKQDASKINISSFSKKQIDELKIRLGL